MQLSNKERKYRCKIIAENHLKKDVQRHLDQYIKMKSLTYKKLYLNSNLLHSMLVQYSLIKLSHATKNLATSCVRATNSLKTLSASFASLGEYEKCKQLKR